MNSGKVLVVEDQPSEIALIERSLSRLLPGVEIKAVATCAQAREVARSFFPQVIITDLGLDERGPCSGFEVIENLSKQIPPPYIVVLTGYPGEDVQKDCIEKGAQEFFTKPVDFILLSASVSRGIAECAGNVRTAACGLRLELVAYERKLIKESLERNGYSIRAVCAELKIGRSTLWRKIRLYDLSRDVVEEV